MHHPEHDISRASAAFLLVAFLVGGLLAPALHRVHDGLLWATQHAGVPETCDHSQHDDSYEDVAPLSFEDQCPLCIRHLMHLDGLQAGLTAYQDFSGYTGPAQLAPETPPFSLPSIRGPPRAA